MNSKKFRNIVIVVFVLIANIVSGSNNQNLLTSKCDFEAIPQMFIEGKDWVDFPKYSDRAAWNKIPTQVKDIILSKAQRISQEQPAVITGYDYLLFKQGNASDNISSKIMQKKSRLEDLILAELLEGKGNYIEYITSSVWDLCALGTWSGPESQYKQFGKIGLPSSDKIVVDEYTGEIAGALSWALFFFEKEFNAIDPSLSTWVYNSVRDKFLKPCQEKYDFFWMCYQSNQSVFQTPWVSYNWMLSNLLIEKDNKVRQKAVYKTFECLDHFYKSFPEDGVCSGGPKIWESSIGKYFQSLELLELVSVGEISVYDDTLLKKMGEYICSAHISGDYILNSEECTPNYALSPSLIFRFGEKVQSDEMKGYGSFLAHQQVAKNQLPNNDLFSKLKYVLNFNAIMAYAPKEPLAKDFFFKESQLIVARTAENSTKGFYFSVKGGANDNFQNQNDAGNFVLYVNGKPMIVDPGMISKKVNDINANRYTVWTNQSAFHNLPTINGYMEEAGANYRIVDLVHNVSDNSLNVSMQLTYAYSEQADIKDWTRSFNFDRSKGLEISDKYILNQIKGDTYISFISCVKPVKNGNKIEFTVDNEKYALDYSSSNFTVAIEEIETSNDEYLKSWATELYRIVLKPVNKSKSGSYEYAFRKI